MVYEAVSLGFALGLILTYNFKYKIMKTITLKHVLQIVMISALILTTVIISKNIIHNVKYLYGLQPVGSGMTCFFDMIQ